MKSNAKIRLSAMLLLTLISGAVFGQTIPPADLPSYSPPLNSSDTAVWLVKYDLVTQEESDLNTIQESVAPANPEIISPQSETSSVAGISGFTNLVPALGLTGWPLWPIGANVRLELTFASGESYICSGTMVGPNYVLTAGHCVYVESYIVAVTVKPTYDYGSSVYPSADGVSVITFNQWISNDNYSYDIAIIELNTSIGYQTGWHGMAWFSDPSVFFNPSATFHNFSYPSRDIFGNPVYDEGERMYYKNGFFDYPFMPGIIGHYQEGFKGQSGSSTYFTSNDNKRYITGVLSHGGPYPTHYTNYAIFDGAKLGYLLSVYPSLPTEPYSPVGLQEADVTLVKLLIYPNPSSTQISFELPQKEQIRLVEIYAPDGKMVFKASSIGSNHFKINLKDLGLTEAIYTVVVHTDAGIVSGRFIYEG